MVPLCPDVGDATAADRFLKRMEQLRVTDLRKVSIDTLTRSMVGLDQYHPKDTGKLFNFGRTLQRKLGCSTWAIDHDPKTNRGAPAGATDKTNSVDYLFLSAYDRATKVATLTPRKVRTGERGQPIMLQGRLQPTGLVDQSGSPISSLVFDWKDSGPVEREPADLSSVAVALRGQVIEALKKLTKDWAASLPEYFTVDQIVDRLCPCERGESEASLQNRKKNEAWTVRKHIRDYKFKGRDGKVVVKKGALIDLVHLDSRGVPIKKPDYRFEPIQPDPEPDGIPEL
jgi:hypothetical protein